MTDKPSAHHAVLSAREYEVLVALGDGDPNKVVAADMGLSVKTTSTYRHRILKKMGFRNNADIIRYCIHNDLVE